ncbi:hypothetical protein HBN50_04055 [Halobacteriovorax sp. GB3]|uniref:hypothetical protein n=1 Tax=Halobacteriovorax sp. GB3 TaxID=2719615 RepID=UPI00235E218B|nr:hypothetical protein [Halobacteriovorax sp. GB3]MDD0852254.1 hypothetical protein [Halobacteriovorax sp. GB3]
MKILILISLFISHSLAFESVPKEKLDYYQKAFKKITYTKSHTIADPISEEPINTKVLSAYDNSKRLLGFIREINTTTGCKSACLPVVFTLFYKADKSYLQLQSKEGLTKKNHAPFSFEDYQRLELLVLMNPPIFKGIKNPRDMVDALSGATKLEYRDYVVKEAAYSTLRISLYNQQTIKELRKIKLN